jgi:hypothetical protein
MPVSDDDYRKRLAGKNNTRGGEVFNPYAAGFSYVGDFVKENMSPLMGAVDQASTDPRQALVTAMLSTAGAGGKGKSVRLVDQLSTPILQRAMQVASMEGKSRAGGWLGKAATEGTKFSQSSVGRAGRAAEDELFSIIDDLERIGVKPQTANRLLKGLSDYVDDPFEGMVTLGENLARRPDSGISAKEALVDRLFKRFSDAAERGFYG